MKSLCRLFAIAALSLSASASVAQTAPCGGNFNAFMQQVGQEARAQGRLAA